jgi:simple sugar transport system permease protein
MFGAALAAGAGWALVAAIPRALIGLNEIITTLFLNYIGILLMDYLIFGPWGDPAAVGFAYSRPLPSGASLPAFGFNRWHIGIFVALALAAALWWLIERTPWGFGVRIAGGNMRAARYLRLPITRRIVVVLALSGALAGLAGAIELTGVTYRLQDGISGNYGYTGILIAFLARRRPFGVVAVAFFFAALLVGSFALQTIGVANAIATIVQALIIIFLLLGEAALTYRVRLPGRMPHVAAPGLPAVEEPGL